MAEDRRSPRRASRTRRRFLPCSCRAPMSCARMRCSDLATGSPASSKFDGFVHAGDGLVIQDQQKQPLVGQNRRSPRFRIPTALIFARVLRGALGPSQICIFPDHPWPLDRCQLARFLSALQILVSHHRGSLQFRGSNRLNRTSEAVNYPWIGAARFFRQFHLPSD